MIVWRSRLHDGAELLAPCSDWKWRIQGVPGFDGVYASYLQERFEVLCSVILRREGDLSVMDVILCLPKGS